MSFIIFRDQEIEQLKTTLSDKEDNFKQAQQQMAETLTSMEQEMKAVAERAEMAEKDAEKKDSMLEDLQSALTSQKQVNAELMAQVGLFVFSLNLQYTCTILI